MKTEIKKLFTRLWRLIFQPASEWERISVEMSETDVARSFVFPLIVVCGLVMMLGSLFRGEWSEGNFFPSMLTVVVRLLALLITFFFVSWSVNQLRMRYLHQDDNLLLSTTLTGFSMSLSFALALFTALFPELILFKWILQFYIVYIVWNGVRTLMKVEENKQMTFTFLVSALLLVVPIIVNFVFDKLVK